MAGGYDYAKEYGKYRPKQKDSKFESYVDANPDLKAAWAEIESDPKGTQGSYWIQRGATSKAAFGRAHAAESGALKKGTYHGGTDVKPSEGKTRFETFLETVANGGNGNGGGDGPPWDDPGNKQNAFHPMLVPEYEAPEAISGIPLDYQPWTSDYQQQYVPESLWNYAPPELTVGRPGFTRPSTGLIDVDRPEYQPQATVKPPLTHLPEGGQDNQAEGGLTNAQKAAMAASIVAKGGWTPGSATNAMQNAIEIAAGGGLDFSVNDFMDDVSLDSSKTVQ